MKSVLITGATGFIASHLIPYLHQKQWKIIGTTRCQSHLVDFSSFAVPVNIGSINGNTDWRDVLQDIDIVIHLAARAHILKDLTPNPEVEFFKVNTEGTANLVRQSIEAKVKHFVFISSIGAMATFSNLPLNEKSSCQPATSYGRSKLEAEKLIIELASKSSMNWTIIRPPLVYGPGNPGNMEKLIQLVNRSLPLPFGLVKNSRSLIYVGNLVNAIATVLTHPKAKNQLFLVSDGQNLSTPQLISEICEQLGKPYKLFPVSPSLLRLAGFTGDTIQRFSNISIPLNTYNIERLLGSLCIDTKHIQTTLNWQPPYTVTQGLHQTLKTKSNS